MRALAIARTCVTIPSGVAMRLDEIRAALRRVPFEPFRIHLTSGQAYDVRHPEFAAVTRHSVYVGLPMTDEEVPDRMVQCDLVHVVALEPIDGQRDS